MSPLNAARCAWEVAAGIIPGEVDTALTRRWGLTVAEWDSGEGLKLFLERRAAAEGYARWLELECSQGRMVNWVRLDFIWF